MNIGKETEKIEFKKSISELKEAIISMASILNKHNKGIIYFGVNNSGDIVGQTIGSNTSREISRRVYESIRPIPIVEIQELEDNGLKYIMVNFQGNEQPYAAYGRYHIRVADEDREMTQEQLKQYFSKIDSSYELWERKTTNIDLKQIDDQLVKRVYNAGIQVKRFSNEYTDLNDVLTRLNLVDKDKVNNAGMYLFSKNRPLTLKLALFATDQKLTFLDQNQFQGNIYECIEEAVIFISKHMKWKAEIGEISRVDIPEIPTRAIREVVINSFAHAKYEDNFIYHEINIFPSKITVFNPGKLSNEINPILDSKKGTTKSIIKNPLIANVLYRTNMIEAFGTGFTRVFELCNDSNIKYEFGNTHHGFEFTFFRTNDVLKEFENVLKELNTTEALVYQLLKNDGNLNSEEIAEKIGKNQKTVLRVFVTLQEKGYLERIGGRKTGYWKTLG